MTDSVNMRVQRAGAGRAHRRRTSHRGAGVGGEPRPGSTVVVVAVIAGICLGAVDLLAQLVLPYPWANLANSSAVWAIGAVGFGAWVRNGAVRCIAAAALLLVVAVEAYYLAAALFLGTNPDRFLSPTALTWAVFGLVAGCVFGLAGQLRAVRGPWLAAVGVALPVAVLLAEAALRAGRGDGAWNHDTQTAIIEVVLAVVVAALAGRGLRGKGAALILAVPFAALGWVAFRLAGFAG